MHDPILYTSDHRQAALQLRASTGSFWLPLRGMASSTQNVSLPSRPLKNYCARLCGVEISLGMLMYSSYTPLPRLISPCLAVARYIFQRPASGKILDAGELSAATAAQCPE